MVDKTQAAAAPQGTAAPTTEQAPEPTSQQTPGQQAGQPKNDQQQVPLPALQEEREKSKMLREQVSNLTNMITEMQNRVAPQQNYPQQMGMAPQQQNYYPAQQFQQAPPNMAQQAEALWADDPMRATAWMVEQGIQNYDGVQRMVDLQKANTMSKYPDYATYATEIDNYVRALPPAQRGQQGIVDMAYFLVKGQKVDTITQQANNELLERIKRGEAVGGVRGTYTAPVNTDDSPLTADENKAAMVMGLTPEEYKANKVRRPA